MRYTFPLLAAMLWLSTALVPAVHANEVKVPINIGVGPAFIHFTGPVGHDQPWHTGLELDLAAVIDQETIRKYRHRIPAQYRSMAQQMKEVKVGYMPIPDMLFISPKVYNTGIYGATWRPLSVGTGVGDESLRLSLSAGLLLTYAFIHSDVLPNTHFLRPGIDGRAELTWRISDRWLMSGGWSSGLYIPQELGGFGLGEYDTVIDHPDFQVDFPSNSIWHIGRAFVKLHYRLPYAVNIP